MIISNSIFSKINLGLNEETHDTEICHYSKSTRLTFTSSPSKSTQAFELVHSDIWDHFLFLLMVLNIL